MSKGISILETTNEVDRSNGLRSFTVDHFTPHTRRIIALSVLSSENLAAPMSEDPVWSADSETNIPNLDLAELLTAFNLTLLRLANLTQLGTGPITLP